jgi:hypothetical protein
MSNERYYSVKPGEVILHSKKPFAVEYRKDLRVYLDQFPRGKDRNDLKRRLHSYTESGFYSACFELYLYHILIDRSREVFPHPDLPNTTTHPEFEVNHDLCRFYLEATLALESEDYQAQEQRLRELVDAVRDVRGGIILLAQPSTHLPVDFPLDSVRDFLLQEVDKLSATKLQLPKTLSFQAVFHDLPIVIDFEILDTNQEGSESVVQAWGWPEAKEVTTHHRIRRRIGVKAGKYGEMTVPYVIAVWPLTEFPLTSEAALKALYGDRQIHLSNKPGGGIIGESRAWNGAFNTVVRGNLLNRQVSAVALYRERFLQSSYSRQLCIYHNPYTTKPILENIFSDLPQFVFRKNDDGSGNMLWLNGVDPREADDF